ncbi:filaggrin-like [Thrips palmi]|uniref:Filaggrin-like n=1 Tax=Thrips palmi TaxID=161013 RepID=A0A6P8ZX49_THRPL|nr:filaggrin-like [Thrips palmi]
MPWKEWAIRGGQSSQNGFPFLPLHAARPQIQEVYARPPADLLFAATNHGHAAAQQTGRSKHAKGGGNKHGKGYHHKQSAQGNDGYKHYDAFHTKSGDKYGYEQHSSFGKKKKGGKSEKYGAAHDAGFAGSHPDVEVVQRGQQGAASLRHGPRSQSLQDMSGDASVDHENTKYRRGLHDDDMFFVFSADGNDNQEDGEGQQQQQAADDDDHDDDGEAAEQQEAADDDDEDDDGQRQKQQQEAEDDYDY